jgi:hypothetical protein
MRSKFLTVGSIILVATAMRGAPTAGFVLTDKMPVPDSYWVYAPAKLGEYTPGNAFSIEPNIYESKTKAATEGVRFTYIHPIGPNPKNPQTQRSMLVDVIKYPSEAAAQAEVRKRVSAAVPTVQYETKVKFPKCNPNKDSDFKGPEELMKKLPLKKGGDAYVLHVGKFWDYACKKATNKEEYVIWSSGVYFFRLSCTGAISEPVEAIFGEGESLFAEYQKALGE